MTVFFLSSFGQEKIEMEFNELSEKESRSFVSYWMKFKNSIDDRDTAALKLLSLAKVDCDICFTKTNNNYQPAANYSVSIDTFVIKLMLSLPYSKLWMALKNEGYSIYKRVIQDYTSENLSRDYGTKLVLYELWVQTYKPYEWAQGHEGQSHAFQFVKYNKEFRFYGITSIP